MFIIALSEYDQTLYEDQSVNRMQVADYGLGKGS